MMPCVQLDCYSVEQLHGHQKAAYAFVSSMPPAFSRPSPWVIESPQRASTGNGNIINLGELQEAKARAAEINKWKVAIQNPLADASINSLTSTAKSLLATINEYGPDKVTFAGLTINSVQIEHLATTLRASSKWKDKITDWDVALQLARTICETKGIDPADLLFGMV